MVSDIPDTDLLATIAQLLSRTVYSVGLDLTVTGVHGRSASDQDFVAAVVGRRPTEAFGHERGRAHEEALTLALKGESVLYQGYWSRDPAARRQTAHAVPVRRAGRIIGALGLIEDDADKTRNADRLHLENTMLEAQFESALDAILTVGIDGRVLSHNRRFAEIWRIPPEVLASRDDSALLGSAIRLLVNPNEFLARVEHLYRHPDETSFEEVQLNDGRTLERYSSPVRGDDGVLHGRIWFFRDITGRKRLLAALRSTERCFTALLERARAIALELDQDGRCLDAWVGDDSLLTVPQGELRGRTLSDALGVELADHYHQRIQPAIRSGEKETFEYSRSIGGKARWFSAEVIRVPGEVGKEPTL